MEKPLIKPKEERHFGTILRNRKLLATIGLLGGLFVLKSTGCLEEKSAGEPEAKKPKLVEQAPNVNKSQQRAREALFAALSKNEESAPEIQVPDDVGFGGPNPEVEDAEDDESKTLNVSSEAKAFLLLPVGAVEGILHSYDLENTPLMNYVKALRDLEKAIRSEDKIKIQDAADEAIRQAEYLQSEEGMNKLGDWKNRFKKGSRKGKRKGKARLKFIIDTCIGSLSYAKSLAGR